MGCCAYGERSVSALMSGASNVKRYWQLDPRPAFYCRIHVLALNWHFATSDADSVAAGTGIRAAYFASRRLQLT
jgi:hypothetical protein